MQHMEMTTLAALLLLLSPLLVVEGNSLDSQNVFRGRKQAHSTATDSRRRSHHASTSSSRRASSLSPSHSSPLRRSENVLGWQQKSDLRKHHAQHRRWRSGGDQRAILHTSTSTANLNEDEEDDPQSNPLHLAPPNLKFEPRKKELWLPWPLGALRNDFHRFADAQRRGDGNEARQEWRPRDTAQPQQQLQSYYGDEGYRSEGHRMFEEGKDWAGRMLNRGRAMLPFPALHPEDEGGVANQEADSQSNYWIKDTTTSMATATMSKNNKNGGMRGGAKGKGGGENKGLDKDVLCKYLKLQASIRLRQLGYVGSDFSVHLPPAAPILLFYYLLPSKKDPIRRLVKYTVSGAALSWMHSEATKYRRFSPLPIMKGVNVRQPNLPPFLPEEMNWEEGEVALAGAVGGGSAVKKGDSAGNKKGKAASKAAKEVAKTKVEEEESPDNRHWDPFQSFGTISSAYRTWLEGYDLRNKQLYYQRRIRAQEQLLAIQKVASNETDSTKVNTGYALVTGASGGIGRALAVELARYRIPLILVARDLTRLSAVAKDIETYYNVPCRILQADLSAPDCASRIHSATTSAGLDVDILVNNAGVCTHGDFLEEDAEDATRMLQVNIGSATQLCRLYGQDMKERRRGRILFVSSMSGALPGCPSVAVYAATKAFGKSLSSSLGREMERYGVGVTCLLPGAVKDTSFASKSEVEDAVCFHFPGYAKTPELVAEEGVKSLMLGYPEVYPGWQNRAFVKTLLPMLPPRMSNIIGEWAWNPWEWGDVMPQRPGLNRRRGGQRIEQQPDDRVSAPSPSASAHTWKFLRSTPNQMQLPASPKQKIAAVPAPSAVELVDPLSDAAPIEKNETEAVATKPTDADFNAETATSPHVNAPVKETDKTNPPVGGVKSEADSSQSIPVEEGSSGQDGESGKEGAVTAKEPTPGPLVLPPASPQQSADPQSSKSLFGFFDREKKASSDSLAEAPTGGDADTSADSAAGSPLSLPSMMDNKDYNFHDRRLDY